MPKLTQYQIGRIDGLADALGIIKQISKWDKSEDAIYEASQKIYDEMKRIERSDNEGNVSN